MQSFFADSATHLPQEGQLHLWAMINPVDNAPLLKRLQSWQKQLANIGFLGLQPASDLHLTLARIAISEGDDDELAESFNVSWESLARDLRPLSIGLSTPKIISNSVIVAGEPEQGWKSLLALSEAVISRAFGDLTPAPLPYPRPPFPHITLAYGIAPGDDHEIEAALPGDTDTRHRNSLAIRISDILLARVFQDCEAGTYRAKKLSLKQIVPGM